MIRMLERDGWRMVRQTGSHRQFRHPEKEQRVTVSGNLGAEIPSGTLASIRRQAGIRGPR
jgi:predicted RNA binding protein YcfA (HicA-like mRNA interferase family)